MALMSGGPQPPLRITGGQVPPGPFPNPYPNGDPYGPPVGPPGGQGFDGGPSPYHQAALAAIGGLENYGATDPAIAPPSVYPGMDGTLATHGAGWEIGGGQNADKFQLVGQNDGVARAARMANMPADFQLQPGMNPEFWSRLAAMRDHVLNSGGDFGIFSGVRNPARQQQLYQAALQRYGSDAAARKVVQPPGSSWHDPEAGMQYGMGPGAIAADLHGHLAMAHRLAPSYGLEFSKTHPWHIQVAGL